MMLKKPRHYSEAAHKTDYIEVVLKEPTEWCLRNDLVESGSPTKRCSGCAIFRGLQPTALLNANQYCGF